MTNKETIFNVPDMHCDACINTITKTLTNNGNISGVQCDLSTKEVKVTYDDGKINTDEILDLLDMIGYSATLKDN